VKTIITFIMGLMIFLLFYMPTEAADTNTTVSSTVTSSNNTVSSNTIDKTPPTASAPNIVINNQDVCVTAVGAAAQTSIVGLSLGTTFRDENCERLKLARSLYGMGMKVASVSLLCQDKRVFDAMNMAGTPCPIDGKIGEEAKQLWEKKFAKVKVKQSTTHYTTEESDLWADEGY
jgi:hypothetical protein